MPESYRGFRLDGSARAFYTYSNGGKLLAFPLEETGGKRSINLVYDAGYPSLPAADKFVEIVKQLYL